MSEFPHNPDGQPGKGLLPVQAEAADRHPVVQMVDGEAMADSRDVAAYFGKDHKRVLQTIREMHCSDDFRRHNFVPFKIKDLTGEATSHVMMTKDGFVFLAMGFTGAKAAGFKERYIAQFNAMEVRLRSPQVTVDPSDPKVMLAVYDHLNKMVAERDGIIAQQAVQVKKLERLEGAKGSMCITDAAKTLGVRPIDLFSLMSAHRWIFKRPGNSSWLAYQDKIQAGLMEHDDHIYFDNQQRERVSTRALVTARGLVKLAEILNKPLH